ncbi:sterol desaturase family protein [Pedobacter sp. SYSU D00535]|uniref:sterol desaturase family protein n=1 Tax=Pedobacter sp. SYSU D00535 TaxID=2810308 RepID=UPI001A95A3D4|nr:sterol desaturase family protein [Pedobacter sp. SYSU D00535]
MNIIRKNFDYIGTPLLAGLFGMLFFLESKYQLRKRVQNRWSRIKINATVAAPSFILLRLMFVPAMVYLAQRNVPVRKTLGLVVPSTVLRQVLAFLFLDYSNYLWHILNHQIPLLWRFHLVHHTDKDLDITTAFRFHFGEMIGSLIYRGACTYLSGATPLSVIVYEIVFEAATEFHHSNTRLPLQVEQALSKLIVTPRMHGVHHSVNRSETDSNFSVIFSCWDRLHQTMNLNVQQSDLIIGVPGYLRSEELSSKFLLRLPFGEIRKG